MKEIRVYMTEDGTRFDTQEEAKEHEALVARGEEIEQWLTEQEFSDKKIPEYRKILLRFIAK